MYARILIVGDNRFGEADYLYRLRCAFERNGHAVAHFKTWASKPITADLISTAIKSFRPTLVLWDVETASPDDGILAFLRKSSVTICALLRSQNGVARVSGGGLFDFSLVPQGVCAGGAYASLTILTAFDRAYGQEGCSSLDRNRYGLLVLQPFDERKSQMIRAMEEGLIDGGAISFDASWSEAYRSPELSNGAYLSRRAKFAVYFEDQDLSLSDVLLRIAEGCVILVEASPRTKECLAEIEGEIMWFRDSSEACALVRRLEDDSLHCDTIRNMQWKRCLGLPSFEEAFEAIFQEMDSQLSCSGSKKRVLSQRERAKRFVLFGWFGARNFGDDLLLEIAALKITRRYSESVVQVIGANSEIIEQDYGFEALTPERKHEIFEMLRGANSLSFYGGLLFDDPMADTAGIVEMFSDAWIEPTGQAGVCLMAWMLGVPIEFMGIGAGPLEKEAPRLAVRTMGLAGARFLPRDEMTCQCLRASGVPEGSISKKVDLAFLLGKELDFFPKVGASASFGLVRNQYFMVSLRTWNLNPPDFCERIAQTLDQVTEKTGYVAAFVPFDQEDIEIHRDIIRLMKNRDAVVVLSERPKRDDLLGLIVDSRFAFAMRLHCSILHHVLGKPAIGLDYNDKICAHFEAMGQNEALLALDASVGDMVTVVSSVDAHYDELSGAICEKISSKADVAQEAFDELFSSVERQMSCTKDHVGSLTFYPRFRSLSAEKLSDAIIDIEKVKGQRDEAASERDAARAAAEECERSYSYRVGSMLLALPRKLRQVLSKRSEGL